MSQHPGPTPPATQQLPYLTTSPATQTLHPRDFDIFHGELPVASQAEVNPLVFTLKIVRVDTTKGKKAT